MMMTATIEQRADYTVHHPVQAQTSWILMSWV